MDDAEKLKNAIEYVKKKAADEGGSLSDEEAETAAKAMSDEEVMLMEEWLGEDYR